MKYVICFDADCDGELYCVGCRGDYETQIAGLKAEFTNVAIIYREWSDGTVEDGMMENGEVTPLEDIKEEQ